MMEPEPTEDITCNWCKIPKQRENFYSGTYSPGWHRQPCKECFREDRRKRYSEKGGAEKSYAQVLRDRYGLTMEEYEQKVRQQGNRCAVCRRPESAKAKDGKPRRLSVDHDHATGATRGLVCVRCNLIVWALEDNHTTLPAIQSYIDTHRRNFSHINDPAIRGGEESIP